MVLASAIIAFLILLTALYVAAEFAAVGARRSRLRRLAEDGNPLAARILPVVEDSHELDRYIAASQVGITLSSLILGAYGQAALAPRLAPLLERFGRLDPLNSRSTAAGIVLLVLTTLAMILGELVPKSLALQYPTRTALATVMPMQWSLRLFSWSIKFLNGSGIAILKLFGVPSTSHRHVHSPEEIALLIAESRDGGLLEPQEQVRLHRALRLGLRSARQLMVPRSRLAGIESVKTGIRDLAFISPIPGRLSRRDSRLRPSGASRHTLAGSLLKSRAMVAHRAWTLPAIEPGSAGMCLEMNFQSPASTSAQSYQRR